MDAPTTTDAGQDVPAIQEDQGLLATVCGLEGFYMAAGRLGGLIEAALILNAGKKDRQKKGGHDD